MRIRIRILQFFSWPSRRQQKTNLKKNFFCVLLFERYLHWHYFSKIQSPKEVTKSSNQGLSYYFCLMIKDPDPNPDPCLWLMDPDPGGARTYGSGGSVSGTLVSMPICELKNQKRVTLPHQIFIGYPVSTFRGADDHRNLRALLPGEIGAGRRGTWPWGALPTRPDRIINY